jgi:hypothetical protein
MAVGAADVAFLDLSRNRGPPCVQGESCHRHPLRRGIAMVEFEDRYIGLTAVDTRMTPQVFID